MSKPLPPNTFFWSNTSPYHDLWEICTLHLKPNLIPRLLFISSMNFISCKCLGSLLPTSKVCWTPKLTLQSWGHLLLPDSINHNQHNHRSIWTDNTIRGKCFSETLEYLTKSWRGDYYNHTSGSPAEQLTEFPSQTPCLFLCICRCTSPHALWRKPYQLASLCGFSMLV